VIGAEVEAKLARTSRSSRCDDDLGSWIADTVQRALAYAVTLVPNRAEAEDIVHDCYSRLLARADRYDLPVDGTRLLYKAITNACINRIQRQPPVVSLEAAGGGFGSTGGPLADKPEAGPEQRAIHGELEVAVAAALAELPVNQRAIVELRCLGHTSAEVAEMLEISQANERVLLHRARQALATRLRPFIEDHVT
jgi:RNA polymerase sigma-70 factor (ECF subfamily)